ncbi:glycerate dehydrogenase [Natronospirillum operosum]|uniref:Glycerate dehydrogenase n=1 Tax=Natronospirillum operosum TaxID=2759953 RepID=A0A4Z0W9Y4_9GAMM|nr:NAD(P)-dependent oxidoreductase [Natronospirillum operosum]TGG92953.1 glycerate dehydrogenase [Natronospirillum operosum]
MTTRRITFLDQGTIPDNIRWPDPDFEHEWTGWHHTSAGQTVERAAGSHILITNKVVVDDSVLAACPDLELVQVSATGVNNVDLEACRQRGIHACNVKGYASNAVPEWVVAHLFALTWRQPHYRQVQTEGRWAESDFFMLRTAPVRELRTMHVGILGQGDIGRSVADRLAAFGTRVEFLERPGTPKPRSGYVDFDITLPRLDALILCCPLTEDNAEMVDAGLLARMKEGALLLNPSRGGLVQEQDLAAAITSGHLGGAALDVVSREPITTDNPLFALRAHENLIVTPHIAWSTDEAITGLMAQLIDNLNRFVAGERTHCLV